jgi:hypothetical protein
MPDETEARLLANVTEAKAANLAASVELTHPDQSIVYGSDIHRKVVETHKAARMKYKAAVEVYRAYCKSKEKSEGLP